MNPKNAIEVRNISKSFTITIEDEEKKPTIFNRSPTVKTKNTIFEDLSFDVRKGDVLGIIGRNGSGKSTLLSLLGRIMEPDSGSIERNGKIASILELGMGFHSDMSGRENIILKSEMYGFSRKETESMIDDIIRYSGIGKYIDNPVRTYSSGMRGRLAFAIMVNVNADIMLVDEVLSVGDAIFGIKAKEHFKKLSRSGKTVIFVSHNLESMESMCNRVIWLEEGKIAMDGNPSKVCSAYRNAMYESPEIIRDLAISGDANSQYNLALLYKDGGVFGADGEQYEYWMGQAASQGHVQAQVRYADILLSKGEDEEACIHYNSAAIRGNAEARMKLSSLSTKSDKVDRLVDLWRQISEIGDSLSKFRYALLLYKIAWNDDDRRKAFDAFVKAADSGYPDAFYYLGVMCRDGFGVKKDLRLMEEYLTKGSDCGHIRSMMVLADIYERGRELSKNEEAAFKMYMKAAEMGDMNAMFKVSTMLKDGIGTTIDMDESSKWLNSYSDTNLYQYYLWASDFVSSGVFKTKDSKYSLCLNAISSKHPAILDVCMIEKYMMGEDYTYEWDHLVNKAKSGNIDAIRRIGNHYYDGLCVKRNTDVAISWFVKAAELGDLWSKNHIGDILKNRSFDESDENKALHWYYEAAVQGYSVSSAHMIEMDIDLKLYGLETKQTILDNIANSNNVDALRRLANFYYDGIYLKKSNELAFRLYMKAAYLGDQFSKMRVAEMYRDGKGTSQNLKESINWFIS